MSAPTRAKFVTGAPLRHIVVMASSGAVGLLAIFLVDFIDLLFIAMLGEDALAAAIGYAGTVLFFVTSIGIGLSIGAGALSARALGRDDVDAARRLAGAAVGLVAVIGGSCAALLFVLAPAALDLLGAEGAAREHAIGYLRITAFGAPFLMLGMAGAGILRAHGDARRAMTTTISAATVNAVLDPLLIFGLDLGLTGAALATVAARVALAAAAFWPLVRIYDAVGPCGLRRARGEAAAILGVAGPAMATNVATPIGNAIVTRTMAEFGTEAVAGYAMVMRLSPLAFCLLFSLSAAVGPIIGQNFGAGRHDRVRETFTKAILFAGAYTILVAALLFVLRDPIADLLDAEGEARRLLMLFCGPLALAFFFNGVLFSSNAAFNNLDRPLYSTALNWGRHTLGTAPFALAGAALYGAPGVLAGQFLGGAVFALAAIWLGHKLIDGHEAGRPPPKFRDMPVVRRGMALFPFTDWRP